MVKAAWLLVVLVFATGLLAAQTNNYPAQSPQGPPTTQTSPQQPSNPTNPTNPSTQMPPDTTAPPAVGTAPQERNEPVLGSRAPLPAYQGGQIAAGSELHAVLDTPLSTKLSKVGDQFTATVTEPLHDAHGAIAVPAGAKIHGEVAEAAAGKTLPSVRGEGRLNLRFRGISLPSGSTEPLAATLVSVHETKGGTASKTGSEGDVSSTTSGGTVAKDVGIGAAAGTVAGLIFGHAIKGLAIGAAAGGGYVLATQGKDVSLPAETGMILRLDQPLSVPAAR